MAKAKKSNSNPSTDSTREGAVAKDVARLAAIEAKCKALYAERDEIEARLIDQVQGHGAPLRLDNGKTVSIADNFVDREGRPRNVAFKTACVKRFEIAVR
jgi:hypothetical protein